MLDFIRIACAVPAVKVGDVEKNVQDICAYMEKADAQKADLLLFPELALTGFTCGDLFFQQTLHRAVEAGLARVAACTAAYPEMTVVVGLPLTVGGKLYNCAAVLNRGKILGMVPKTQMDAAEKRWFAAGEERMERDLGSDLGVVTLYPKCLFDVGGAMVGVEICEDLMTPMPASSVLAVNGAEVILNLSASEQIVGKSDYRRELVKHQSGACSCIYAFCSAGYTESTSDMVLSGHSLIGESGHILQENPACPAADYLLVQDCDLGKIRAQRLRKQNFAGAAGKDFLIRSGETAALRSDGDLYPVSKLPFIPSEKIARAQRCREVFEIQVVGLMQRLKTIRAKAVIGISGGLDSTLALLVAVEAMGRLGRPLTDVHGITMPCFGTSDRTYQNAWELMRTLGITCQEISIKDAVSAHFRDIGHDPAVHDTTYENAQARERTQILMDYAGKVGGIVVGTGDLSEMALGWCTYNGDHMSMYSVNGSVPKTLIRWIIQTVAEAESFSASKSVLLDILDTPISPELLPPDATGKISQQTEDIVGPYALHDFFLYYMVRYGFCPEKIYTMACRAFRDDFDAETVKKWLRNFYRRFFAQQFKRNCQPDGVKVGDVSFSPRADWRMPSDACGRIWQEEAERL